MEKWSGERLETFIFGDTAVEHLHRYSMASILVKDKVVLDIACGEGYGSLLLSKIALQVIGVDIDAKVINNASLKYKNNNLKFLTGSAESIPVDDKSIDVLVSFETIEHHDKHDEMFMEIKRVLKPNGILLMSSPDKKHYIQLGKNNPFHIKELFLEEFEKLVFKYFQYSEMYFQKCVNGSSLIANISDFNQINVVSGNYDEIFTKEFLPLYNVVIASNEKVTKINLSIFDGEIITNKINSDNINYIRSSTTFRLGSLFIKPFIKLKTIFYR
jgi:ubiquinone/menaquinone biosynthesis C-methylase UbiE